MRFVVGVCLAAVVALPGCMDLADGFSGPGGGGPDVDATLGTCPDHELREVRVVGEGLPAPLDHVEVRATSHYGTMLSCVGPPHRHALDATDDGSARGDVGVGSWSELRLVTTSGVVRAAMEWRVDDNGTLRVEHEASEERPTDGLVTEREPPVVRLAWNGAPVRVIATESLDDPDALDDHRRYHSTYDLEDKTTSWRMLVNTSWNGGAYARASLTSADPGFTVDPRPDPAGASVTLRLLGSDGAELRRVTSDDWFDDKVLTTGPLEPGEYTWEITTRKGSPSVRAGADVEVSFTY